MACSQPPVAESGGLRGRAWRRRGMAAPLRIRERDEWQMGVGEEGGERARRGGVGWGGVSFIFPELPR